MQSIDHSEYVALIEQRDVDQKKYDKIRSDSFRTFVDDIDFKRVSETSIVRVCNSFVNKYRSVCGFCDQKYASIKEGTHRCTPTERFTYCQGMNAILGPFLY